MIMEENFYKTIIEKAPFGFAYHQMVRNSAGNPLDYTFIDVNDFFADMLSLRKTEIIGKTVVELMPGIINDTFNWISFYGDIADTGGNVSFEQYSLPLGKWFRINAFSDKPGYFTTIFTDITEDVKREIRLTNSIHKTNFLLDNIPDVIWTMDLSGKYIYVSESTFQLRGYTAEENKQQTLEETLTPASVVKARALFSEAAQLIASGKKETRRVILEQYCKDGTTVQTDTNISLVYDHCNNFKYILGVTRKHKK